MAFKNSSHPVHHIEIKRHHKIIIGSVSSLLIILVIINSVMLYFLYGQLEIGYNQLNSDITKLEADTNSKLSEITDSVISTRQDLSSLEEDFGKELNLLKASVGVDFSGVIELVVPSVVTVRTDISQGTGFIITNDGYIITNYHVVKGAKAAGIYTYEGEQHQVSLVGYNEDLDIALLKIAEIMKHLN